MRSFVRTVPVFLNVFLKALSAKGVTTKSIDAFNEKPSTLERIPEVHEEGRRVALEKEWKPEAQARALRASRRFCLFHGQGLC